MYSRFKHSLELLMSLGRHSQYAIDALRNHEQATARLATVTGDLVLAKQISKSHKTPEVEEITKYVATGIAVESAIELVNMQR